jgi:hypothetical protein
VLVLLCPLQQPPDRLSLPGIKLTRFRPGGYLDFEPDFQPARPFPSIKLYAISADSGMIDSAFLPCISWVFSRFPG